MHISGSIQLWKINLQPCIRSKVEKKTNFQGIFIIVASALDDILIIDVANMEEAIVTVHGWRGQWNYSSECFTHRVHYLGHSHRRSCLEDKKAASDSHALGLTEVKDVAHERVCTGLLVEKIYLEERAGPGRAADGKV